MICNTYKPRGSRIYRGRFRFEGTRIHSVSLGTTDKQIADKRLRELVLQRQREAAGLAIPQSELIAAERALERHLDDFIAAKEGIRDQRYLYELKMKVRKVSRECGWLRLSDVREQQLQAWLIASPRSAKTNTEYFGSLNVFLNWCVKRRLLAANPISSVEIPPSAVEPKYQRRSFSEDELARLFCGIVRNRGRDIRYHTFGFDGVLLSTVHCELCPANAPRTGQRALSPDGAGRPAGALLPKRR